MCFCCVCIIVVWRFCSRQLLLASSVHCVRLLELPRTCEILLTFDATHFPSQATRNETLLYMYNKYESICVCVRPSCHRTNPLGPSLATLPGRDVFRTEHVVYIGTILNWTGHSSTLYGQYLHSLARFVASFSIWLYFIRQKSHG